MDSLWQDIRYALRQLRRAPAFALTAIVTLALGVGANTGVYSIINGIFRPLPVPDADRIVVLAADVPGDDTGLRFEFSYPALGDYRQQTRDVFSALFAFETRLGGLANPGGQSSQFLFQAVAGNFFDGLGLTPAAGRLLYGTEGEAPGSESVIVLGYEYWHTRFGGDPAIINTMLRLDGRPARVIGVAPEGFRGLYNGMTMNGYMPLASLTRRGQPDWYVRDRAASFLTVVGRLAPGVTLTQAQSAVNIVAERIERAYPATEQGVRVRVIPEPGARPAPLRFFGAIIPVIRTLVYLLSTMVLLLACLNVTNLLFVRATTRAREMAVRTALGSGRQRLIRLLMIESAALAVAGTAIGVLVGRTAGMLLAESIDLAVDVPISIDFRYDWPVFQHAILTAIGTALVIGLVPAFRASRTQVTSMLRDGGQNATTSVRRQRMRSGLVVSQVAGSLVLLMVAGFLVRSLQRADSIDLGFDPSNLLTVNLDPGQLGYDDARIETFFTEVERRARSLPGVEHAALSFNTPMSYMIGACPVQPEGAMAADDRSWLPVAYNSAGTDYFTTMRMPLVRGRAFEDRDADSMTAMVIVNETLAARFWPATDPIGKRMMVRCMTPARPWEVIGVVRDARYIAVFEHQQPYLYVNTGQTRPTMRTLQVRSAAAPGDLGNRLRREIAAIDPDVPVGELRTMRGVISGSLGNVMFRVGAIQASALGMIGLILAVVGVYGVVSYGASQRTREIGIRLALGANPGDVRRLVLRHGAVLVVAGVAIGLGLSLVVTEALTRFVVLVSATDPWTVGGVTVVLGAIVLVACYLPARRAMRIDAMTALRHE